MRVHLSFLLFFYSAMCFAQDPSSIHLTEKDGLPDVEIYDIYEDSEGFIWLAADKGLFKYDGKNYTSYTHAEKRGLSVFDIIEDDIGRIWCKNITGQIFYVQNEKMHLFYDLNLLRYGLMVQILFRPGKVILSPLYSHMMTFEDHNGVFKKVETDSVQGKTLFSGQILEHQEKFYNTLGTSFVEVSLKNTFKELFKHDSFLSVSKFNTFIQHKDKVLMYRSSPKNNLFLVDIESEQITAIELPQALNQLSLAKIISLNGFLWFCTNKGVLKYRLENNKLLAVNEFLEDYFVSDIIIDKDHNYWVSTIDAGLFVIPNIYVKKYKLSKEVSNLKAIKNYKNGRLLLGSFDGSLGSYDPVYQDYKLINKSNAKVSEIIYLKEKDYIFSSSDEAGFSAPKKYKKAFKDFGNLKDFSEINDTCFLIASYNRTDMVTLTSSEPFVEQRPLNENRTYSCHYETHTKSYYAGNTDNLKRYDSLFKEHVISYNGAPIFVLDMAQTENNTLWVTTFKHGVLGIRNDSVIASFNSNNGLSTNRTSYLYAENEYLWIATQEGVAQINTITEEINLLTKQDGIPSFKIEEITGIGNEIFFASNEGLFSVDKNKAFIERKAPEVYFTSIAIADKDTLLKPSYKLPHDKNRIEIAFHSNGFQTDKNLIYEYKLNDQPELWQPLQGGVNSVTFSNIEHGNYDFKVRARNLYNSKVSSAENIAFTVDLPYWKRWWFVALFICLSLLLIALYFKEFQKRKEKEQVLEVAQLQLKNQLTSLKLENLRSQMNPHFIFNALNSIQEYIVLNQKDLASDYLGKFADLVRTYLRHSGEGTISLQEEIDCLDMYLELEKLRFEDTLEYTIHIAPDVNADQILIPTMLVQPYVENAIKHGLLHKRLDRKLWISFFFGKDSGTLLCEVQDNGVGRAQAQKFQQKRKANHQSFATQATDDRLSLINKNSIKNIGVVTKDLFDDLHKPEGTKVIITIPISS